MRGELQLLKSNTYLEMSVTGLKSNLGAKTLYCSETIERTTELVFCEGIYDLLS